MKITIPARTALNLGEYFWREIDRLSTQLVGASDVAISRKRIRVRYIPF